MIGDDEGPIEAVVELRDAVMGEVGEDAGPVVSGTELEDDGAVPTGTLPDPDSVYEPCAG